MHHEELNFPNFRFDSNGPHLKGWRTIFENKEHKKYQRKEIIIEQGQKLSGIYYIISGLAEYIYNCEDGTQEILEVLGAGNMFGLQPLFGDNPAIGSVVALEDCLISSVDAQELNAYIEKDPQLSKELLLELSKITGGLIRRIYEQTFSADRRVEKAIYLLANHKKNTTNPVKKLSITLCQDDLARITRTTRVTVTKALGELKRQNLIQTSYGEIIVLDLDRLREKAFHD